MKQIFLFALLLTTTLKSFAKDGFLKCPGYEFKEYVIFGFIISFILLVGITRSVKDKRFKTGQRNTGESILSTKTILILSIIISLVWAFYNKL